MIYFIDLKDLKVGMYVILPRSWFRHPFLKNRFLITSEEQIETLSGMGLREIEVDSAKSQLVEEVESISHPAMLHPPQQWEPEKLISDDLREVVYDTTVEPQEKAQVVYHHSIQLMQKVWDSPTRENIKDGKKGISHVVDLILHDDETSLCMLNIVSHDFYTYTHSVNVGVLSVMLSKELFRGSDDHDLHELGAGFFLHDLGKLKIDPNIINKPGRLDNREQEIMRSHPYQGFKVLRETDHLSDEVKTVIFQHHEREDGTGYPRRLKGDEIHVYGRICCIADVFDALTAERSYKRKLSPFQALKIMKEEMLGHFHEDMFKTFVLLFN